MRVGAHIRDAIDMVGAGAGIGYLGVAGYQTITAGWLYLEPRAHREFMGWGSVAFIVAVFAYMIFAGITGVIGRTRTAFVAAERDEARLTAEVWREAAVSRAHVVTDLRRENAVLHRQLEAAYDAVGRFSVEAQRQPVRGEGGRFKKRVSA